VIRSLFADARSDFQAKELERARGKFERVLALTNDPAAAGAPDLKDLKILTTGYLEIVKNSPSPAAVPPTAAASAPRAAATSQPLFPSPPVTPPAGRATPAAAPNAPAASPVAAAKVRSATVVPAVTIRQDMPAYTTPAGTQGKALSGSIRIVIGVDGKVKDARIEKSVEPRYDNRLMQATKSWSYKPATLNGEAVESEKLVTITVGPQ
jgi:TonB family protein